MPYVFRFTMPSKHYFEANVECMRCKAFNKSGGRCNRHVCIGSPFCWVHLLYQKHLRIKASRIPHGGKGLFALNPSLPDNDVIFADEDKIVEYTGQRVPREEISRRYGNFTATYALEINSNKVIDAALSRSVGCIANHKPGDEANAEFILNRNNRVFLQATKPIRNNEEIFVDYGDAYKFDEGVVYTTRIGKVPETHYPFPTHFQRRI